MECQKCHTENPTGAKYCRKCGRSFDNKEWAIMFLQTLLKWIINAMSKSWDMVTDLIRRLKKDDSGFTPDTFKSITLCPRSMVTMRFIKKSHWICTVLFGALFYLLITWNILCENILGEHEANEIWTLTQYAAWLSLILCAWFWLLFARDVFRKILYILNADYQETGFVKSNIVRIAKNNKLGLFDKKSQRVLLWTRYDDISKMDESHLLLTKGGNKGLYSLTYKKVIVPIKYTRISAFSNYVTTATNADGQVHYDIKGNELK